MNELPEYTWWDFALNMLANIGAVVLFVGIHLIGHRLMPWPNVKDKHVVSLKGDSIG